MAESDSGMIFDAGTMRVGDYLDGWLDSIRDALRRRTWIRHEEIVRLHLKPSLGIMKLDRVGVMQIQSLYRSKLDSGLLSQDGPAHPYHPLQGPQAGGEVDPATQEHS